jgi:hypothetical protein
MSSIGMRTSHARWAVLLAGACLAFGTSGCFVEASTDAGPPPPPAPVAGSLTLRWTVDELTDPNVCIMGNAATLDVVLTTSSGQFVGEFAAACTSFSTTISSLAEGGYAGTAQLLDSAGRPRTTVIDLEAFTILENSNLIVDLDFPADSFL